MPSININNHEMYYEIHGEGDPAVCMGGWGTFCHGNEGLLARGLTDKYQVLVFDYRGIRDSSDDSSIEPSMKMHADVIVENHENTSINLDKLISKIKSLMS